MLGTQAINLFIGFDSVIIGKDAEIARLYNLVEQSKDIIGKLEDNLDDRKIHKVMQFVANDGSKHQTPQSGRMNVSVNSISGEIAQQPSSLVVGLKVVPNFAVELVDDVDEIENLNVDNEDGYIRGHSVTIDGVGVTIGDVGIGCGGKKAASRTMSSTEDTNDVIDLSQSQYEPEHDPQPKTPSASKFCCCCIFGQARPSQVWRPPLLASVLELGGVKIAKDDVVRDYPTNNVPDSIFIKLGMRLHRRDQHPIGILKNAIYSYFDTTYSNKLDKFDYLCPIVSVKQVKLIDNFTKKKGMTSHCYRIAYRSM
ncbi:hypothetical protein LOK49_LG09G02797 [Camellia lanceoleosa]|uniref:Uncharacterized protein n=1 Tax=Camellia lanceoleosa TaxID=1840588 RepID=A0ACC0GHG2_9ERIC|nr:hypothetical protein LOK49_LG09G02797 [Camellia lanceoleosa]